MHFFHELIFSFIFKLTYLNSQNLFLLSFIHFFTHSLLFNSYLIKLLPFYYLFTKLNLYFIFSKLLLLIFIFHFNLFINILFHYLFQYLIYCNSYQIWMDSINDLCVVNELHFNNHFVINYSYGLFIYFFH